MKKRTIILIASMLSGILFISSCTKDLKLTPSSIISVNSFWKTPDDAQGGLYAMYDKFRDFAGSGKGLIIMGAARSGILGSGGLQNADWRIKYFENTLNAANADLDWKLPYLVIDYANLIIKYVPDIKFTDESTKNSILAQAYAMRAYMYFTMVKTWGGLPLITQPTEGFDAKSTYKSREPVSDIFKLIKQDIEQALKLFPDNNYPAGRSMWSKSATNTLKGYVYLWSGKRMEGGSADFKIALQAINAAQESDVVLLNNFRDIFSYTNKGNKEVIFAAHYQELESGNNYFADMYIRSSDIPTTIDKKTAEILGGGGNYNWWAPAELIRDQFTEDDQRKDATFVDVYSHINGVPKFVTSVVVKCKGIVVGGVREFIDDVVIYRYGGLLLLKAEVENALGIDPSAEINEVRKRAYGDNFPAHKFIPGTKAENDEAILKERLLELAFEGHRWFDLRRFSKVFDLVPSLQGKSNDKYLLLFPISQETITLNPKVEQNPGY